MPPRAAHWGGQQRHPRDAQDLPLPPCCAPGAQMGLGCPGLSRSRCVVHSCPLMWHKLLRDHTRVKGLLSQSQDRSELPSLVFPGNPLGDGVYFFKLFIRAGVCSPEAASVPTPARDGGFHVSGQVLGLCPCRTPCWECLHCGVSGRSDCRQLGSDGAPGGQ